MTRQRPRPLLPLAFAACWLIAAAPPVVRTADALPLVTIDDARSPEGNEGTRTLVFKVHLSDPAPAPVTVDFATEDGTATVADQDYDPASGQVVFSPGAMVQTLYVDFHGDTKLEGNEWFRVRLSNAIGAAIADSEAIGTLVNDDGTSFAPVNESVSPYFAGTLANAWGDFDGDGIPDLPLYRVQPFGGLSEIPDFRALLENGNYHGAAWCDYDRDGDPDLILLGYSGVDGGAPTPTRLLRNDGHGVFEDVAPSLGLDVVGAGETAVWADFDGDHWPDLFTPYYSHIAPFRSFLYHNDGDGTFTDVAEAAGVSLPGLPIELRPEGAVAADWNDDGHTDLYTASHLFVNDGTGTFTDVRASVGLPILFDEGACLVDIDNDGDLDLYLRTVDGPRLFRNDSGMFTDVTTQAGLGPLPLFWGDSWADVDGDGDLDLLLQSGDGTTLLMLNQGDGTFVPDTAFANLHVPADLSAWADIDQDGDVDLAIGSGARRQIYRNLLERSPGYRGSHLAVRVLAADGTHTAFGATVRLHTVGGPPGTTQTRVIDGGSGYLGQNEYDVHFGGLGSGRFALEVVYPSPAGMRVVVDSLANAILGSLEPSSMDHDLVTVYPDGLVELSGEPAVAGVEARGGRSSAARLGAPSPSPARGAVTLPVDLAARGAVTVDVHDLGGRLTRRLDPGDLDPGAHDVRWDLRDEHGATAAPGIYFARLIVDGRVADSRRLVVLR